MTTQPRSFVTTRTSFDPSAEIADLMASVNPVKWISRGLRVEPAPTAWTVMFRGPRRWWCQDRAVLTVYRTDSPAGQRLAKGITTTYVVIYDTELADDVAEPVESIEQLAEIAVTCAAVSSPEDRAAMRMARAG